MKRLTFLTIACLTIWLASCGGGERASNSEKNEPRYKESKQDSPSDKKESTLRKEKEERNAVPPMVSNANLKQTNRDFVRTADVRFQVKNVYKTTLEMESLVTKYKGFITETILNNEVVRTQNLEVSRDSILHITSYRVNNQLTIRLPQDSLDLFMGDLTKWLVFLDHRTIKAEDVTTALKSNDMRSKRAANYEQRYTKAIDNQGEKLDETTTAEDKLLQQQNEADQNVLNQEALRHKVQYSTLNLNIYQAETIHRNMIENYRKIEQYEPSFWAKLADSFAVGWKSILSFFVAITVIWPFWIIVAVGAWLVLRNPHWWNK